MPLIFQSKSHSMPPLQHMEELRYRLIYSVVAWVFFSLLCFAFAGKILEILTQPVPKLVLLTPTEAFMAHVRIALIGGAALAAPMVLHQFLLFLLPALKKEERRGLVWIVPLALLLFACGAAMANFVLLPFAIRFFLSYTSDKIQEMISLSNYVDFVLSFLVAGGLVFELPLVMMGLGKIGIAKSHFLRKHRKEAILIILITTAILSPSPEVFSWLMLSGCMVGLFEFSIWLVKIVER